MKTYNLFRWPKDLSLLKMWDIKVIEYHDIVVIIMKINQEVSASTETGEP